MNQEADKREKLSATDFSCGASLTRDFFLKTQVLKFGVCVKKKKNCFQYKIKFRSTYLCKEKALKKENNTKCLQGAYSILNLIIFTIYFFLGNLTHDL